MDRSVDGENIRQKFCRVRNRVERFQGGCLLIRKGETEWGDSFDG